MVITDDEIDAATGRAEAKKSRYPAVTGVRYDRHTSRVVIALASGIEISFSPRNVEGLETARPDELSVAEISASGFGVHFPKLDADIYIPALLEGVTGSERWMAAQIGKLGGKARSDRKTAAARQNGKLGGRPRKTRDVVPD